MGGGGPKGKGQAGSETKKAETQKAEKGGAARGSIRSGQHLLGEAVTFTTGPWVAPAQFEPAGVHGTLLLHRDRAPAARRLTRPHSGQACPAGSLSKGGLVTGGQPGRIWGWWTALPSLCLPFFELGRSGPRLEQLWGVGVTLQHFPDTVKGTFTQKRVLKPACTHNTGHFLGIQTG